LPGWKAHRTASRRSLLCGLEPACTCRAFCRLIGLIAISRHRGKPQPASGPNQFPAQLPAGMAAGGDDLQKNSFRRYPLRQPGNRYLFVSGRAGAGRAGRRPNIAAALVAAAGEAGGIASQTYWPRLLRKPQLNLSEAQARYAYFDTSFEVVRQLLSIPHDIPCDDLCEFLKQQTNIPASVMVSPVEFKLAPQFKPATGAL